MRLTRVMTTIFLFVNGVLGAPRASVALPPEAPDQVFGIRLGASLDSQFAECPAGETSFTSGTKPCWKRDQFGTRVVLLPKAWLAEIGAIGWVERVREWDGVVVEVDVEFRYGDRKRVERHLLRRKGKPAETETYEMDSRVFRPSKHRAHTWRGGGVTTFFVERTGSEHTRVRAFLDSWAQMEADQKQREGGSSDSR